VRVADIVVAEAALDAEALMIGRAVAAVHVEDLVVLDLVGELTADAAERAEAVDLAVGPFGANLLLVQHGRRHQGAGRAGLDAFAASNAGALAHQIVEIEDDLRVATTAGHADHV